MVLESRVFMIKHTKILDAFIYFRQKKKTTNDKESELKYTVKG